VPVRAGTLRDRTERSARRRRPATNVGREASVRRRPQCREMTPQRTRGIRWDQNPRVLPGNFCRFGRNGAAETVRVRAAALPTCSRGKDFGRHCGGARVNSMAAELFNMPGWYDSNFGSPIRRLTHAPLFGSRIDGDRIFSQVLDSSKAWMAGTEPSHDTRPESCLVYL
jgi:hypothetical protein